MPDAKKKIDTALDIYSKHMKKDPKTERSVIQGEIMHTLKVAKGNAAIYFTKCVDRYKAAQEADKKDKPAAKPKADAGASATAAAKKDSKKPAPKAPETPADAPNAADDERIGDPAPTTQSTAKAELDKRLADLDLDNDADIPAFLRK